MRKIIILEIERGQGGFTLVQAIFRIAVQAGREILRPGNGSLYEGATVAEIVEIEAGRVLEERLNPPLRVPDGTSATAIQNQLVLAYNAAQAYHDGLPFRRQFYGRGWDGTTWS